MAYLDEKLGKNEYLALEEFCLQNDYSVEVRAVSFATKRVVIKIEEGFAHEEG